MQFSQKLQLSMTPRMFSSELRNTGVTRKAISPKRAPISIRSSTGR